MLDTKILIALTIYITAIFMSNLLGLKTMPFLFGTHISFAVFTLPFVFITTDVIGKVYGKALAKQFVFLGFFSLTVWTLFSLFADILPWSSSTYDRIGVAYDSVFSLSIRVALASLSAFLISEYLDVLIFFRYKHQKRSFWMASLASNVVSQLIDTGVFMLVAFYWVFDLEKILMMSIPWWIYKVSMGVLYMPFSYLALTYFSRQNHE